ncbi:MAG: hypothetical protein ACKOIA_07955 [Acidimicrobiia bacterium]
MRSARLVPVITVVLAMSVLVAACGSSSTSSVPTTTSTTAPRAPSVHVLGDGVASEAAASVAAALGSTDVVDRSVSRSAAVTWLNLRDPDTPVEGANHELLAASVADAPSIVLLSLGADLVPPTEDPDMDLCQPMTIQSGSPSSASSIVTDCARAVLAKRLLRQRTMAVAFDVLAGTRNTRMLVVGSGAPPGTIGAAVDAELAAAVLAVTEAGAAWGSRIAYAPSPTAAAAVVQERGWV